MATCPGVEPDIDGQSDDSGCGCRVPPLGTSGGCRRNKRKSTEPKRRQDVLQMKRFRWESDASDTDCIFEEERERPSSGDSGCQMGSGTDSWPSPDSPCKPSTPPVRNTVIQNSKNCKSKAGFVKPTTGVNAGPSTGAESDRFVEPSEPLESEEQYNSRKQGYRPRNYKSMSRQRRIEANARERTRVHTISAAFESLRRAVPAYADSQKLSKLAILRIASSYILSLACLNDLDYSKDQLRPNFAECVDLCTKTIQAEGRTRRRGKE